MEGPGRKAKKPEPEPLAARRSADEAAAFIEMLVSRAPALHAAGITSLSVDGVAITIAPPPPPPAKDEASAPPPPTYVDPLADPSTFAGGRVPGFKRPKD